MYWYKFQYYFWSSSRDQNHKVPPHLKHELLVGHNGGVVAPPNGELVPTYGWYIVPWAPTMDIDTSFAFSALLIVEI